jgi:hypothetical protein
MRDRLLHSRQLARSAGEGCPRLCFGLTLLCLFAAPTAFAYEPAHILIIDGDGTAAAKKGGAFFVETAIKSLKDCTASVKDAAELEKADLRRYPLVFLVNVAELSEKARTNLEAHVRAGGGAAFFLGDRVKPAHYNRLLYRKGEGIFPVQLAGQPTEPPSEETKKKEKASQPKSGRPSAFLRDPRHPLGADLADMAEFFKSLEVDRHFPIVRSKRDQSATRVQEVIALPNESDVTDYKDEAQKLNRLVPTSEEQYKEFRPGLEWHQWAVRQTLVFGKKAWELGEALDALLEDRGDPKDADKPDLTAFWGKAELKDLRQKLAALRDRARYADPLVVASTFGKGRVVVCLTSLGGDWNDWVDGPASPTFVILTANMVKHLAGGASEKRP